MFLSINAGRDCVAENREAWLSLLLLGRRVEACGFCDGCVRRAVQAGVLWPAAAPVGRAAGAGLPFLTRRLGALRGRALRGRLAGALGLGWAAQFITGMPVLVTGLAVAFVGICTLPLKNQAARPARASIARPWPSRCPSVLRDLVTEHQVTLRGEDIAPGGCRDAVAGLCGLRFVVGGYVLRDAGGDAWMSSSDSMWRVRPRQRGKSCREIDDNNDTMLAQDPAQVCQGSEIYSRWTISLFAANFRQFEPHGQFDAPR
ncbi:Uu.00g057650.m01.CDS01 [Anthostomella pinea]|uniref:Uu.00g057650.m01.CDS01 n=1 Tax=Anthostomella pinea TaxID=933095 RepID=A0AAI8VL60_9PEZI|nr:Uu.00g057650.m01.CDS01 [Anthostomella pinea]